jgi:hypothetical protein
LYLDQGTDHAQRSEPEIFKGSRLAHRVQEWIEEEWNASWVEEDESTIKKKNK